MTYDEMPDIQREILRVLFLYPNLDAVNLRERVYYPDGEVQAAVEALIRSGCLWEKPYSKELEPSRYYEPAPDLRAQMQARQNVANRQAQEGLNRYKQQLDEEDRRRLDDPL